MKVFTLLLFAQFVCLSPLEAQSGQRFSADPMLGLRFQSDENYDASTKPRSGFPITPIVGAKISVNKWALSFEANPWFVLNYALDTNGGKTYDIPIIRKNWDINLSYQFKRLYLGIGHNWRRTDADVFHIYPNANFVRTDNCVNLLIGKQISGFNVEFRSRIKYSHGFSALVGTSNYSLAIYRQFNKERRENSTKPGSFKLAMLLGVHFFGVDKQNLYRGEDRRNLAIAPLYGFEFMWKNRLSFGIDRNLWLAFNGGGQHRDLKNYQSNTAVGFRYHHKFKSGNHLRAGLSGMWIVDKDELVSLSIDEVYRKHLYNFQVKGIGASLSWEFYKNTDLEIRNTFPLIGRKMFDIRLFSVGLVRRVSFE